MTGARSVLLRKTVNCLFSDRLVFYVQHTVRLWQEQPDSVGLHPFWQQSALVMVDRQNTWVNFETSQKSRFPITGILLCLIVGSMVALIVEWNISESRTSWKKKHYEHWVSERMCRWPRTLQFLHHFLGVCQHMAISQDTQRPGNSNSNLLCNSSVTL